MSTNHISTIRILGENYSTPNKKARSVSGGGKKDLTFECEVRKFMNTTIKVCSKTEKEFWDAIEVAHGESIYRDYVGIQKVDTDLILLPNTANVEPGKYKLVGHTQNLTNRKLDEEIRIAVEKLKALRPHIDAEKFGLIQQELIIRFNHFSLVHEGSSLKFDETTALVEIIAKHDWKHEASNDEEVRIKVSESNHDETEAINHIRLSLDLTEIARQGALTESRVLGLHLQLMTGLLKNPGEYRKVAVMVGGDPTLRAHPDYLNYAMEEFFEDTMIQQDGERIFDFLARIHTSFQHIHPFLDGNGRIGRIMMNVLLIQQGYPVLALPTTLSTMFNHAVQIGCRGLEYGIDKNVSEQLFSRICAEAVFASLQAYEYAIGKSLLPSIQDAMGQENICMRAPAVAVFP